MDTTLKKGLKLLEILAAARDPRGVSDLAAELGIVKSNVHRLLQSLTAARYVRKVGAPAKYHCTLKLFELGSQLLDSIDVKEVAAPQLRKLALQTQESAYLSILDGLEVVYLDKADSPQPVRAYVRLGERTPAYCVATGKAMLAFEPIDALSALLPLKEYTPNTISDFDALLVDLSETRKRGYAVNRGGWSASVFGIAAPIYGRDPKPIAALGISGPMNRFEEDKIEELAQLVKGAAHEVSFSLGHRGGL